MPSQPRGDASVTTLEPITDHETLREYDGVPYHEESDVVDAEIVDFQADAPDLAAVGVTNDDRQVLLRRLTETCSWKLPVASVAPDEDYAAAIRDQIPETIGLTVALETVAGVWDLHVRTEDGEQTASRAFVVFGGTSLDGYDLDAATPEGDGVEDAGWFDALPEDADRVPGTDLFFD